MNSVRTLAAFALLSCAAAAQSGPALPEEVLLLSRIKRKAIDDLARIPNYVCIESIERYRRAPRETDYTLLDRVFLEVANIAGKERFAWPGKSGFQDKAPSELIGSGASATGEFANHIAGIFKNYATTIRYAGKEEIDGRPAARYDYSTPLMASGLTVGVGSVSGRAAIRGSFWADTNSFDLLRVDVEAVDIPPEVPVQTSRSRTDYWRVRMGDTDALLARKSDFLMTDLTGTEFRNLVVFSSCREFVGETTLTFGAEPAIKVSDPPAIEAARLAEGLELTLVLDTAIDAARVAAGAPVRAHVADAAGEIPGGARVHGRVNRIIRYEAADQVLIGLEFAEIEYRRKRAPFIARLIAIDPEPKNRRSRVLAFGYFAGATAVQYDPPGTASLYVAASDATLPHGFRTRWLTTEKRD